MPDEKIFVFGNETIEYVNFKPDTRFPFDRVPHQNIYPSDEMVIRHRHKTDAPPKT